MVGVWEFPAADAFALFECLSDFLNHGCWFTCLLQAWFEQLEKCQFILWIFFNRDAQKSSWLPFALGNSLNWLISFLNNFLGLQFSFLSLSDFLGLRLCSLWSLISIHNSPDGLLINFESTPCILGLLNTFLCFRKTVPNHSFFNHLFFSRL